MSQTTDDLQKQLQKSLADLATMRDEIRLQIHLAGKEAKAKWEQQLEPRFAEAEQHVKEAGEAARSALGEIVKAFQSFRTSLGSGSPGDSASS